MHVASTSVRGMSRRDVIPTRESVGTTLSGVVGAIAEPYRVISPQLLVYPSGPLILCLGKGSGIQRIVACGIKYCPCRWVDGFGPSNRERIDQVSRNLVT